MLPPIQLLDVTLLDLVQCIFAPEKIRFKLRGDLPRHHLELVVHYLTPRHRPARGNQMRSPLEN